MCGIAGTLGVNVPDFHQVQSTLVQMRQRGPDASGVFKTRMSENELTLLHTRLSIIDLDPRANQPFERHNCVLVYNGEIYNYLELKHDLESAGYKFTTQSDTEVVLNAYLHYGLKCFEYFEGMWAIALFDEKQQHLVLSRDRFGEKPLFYWLNCGTLYFASEIKALVSLSGQVPEPDLNQVKRYLVNGYRSLHKHASSYFHDIESLPPATFAVVTSAEKPDAKRYWHLSAQTQEMSLENAIDGVRHHLNRSLDWRLRADVPVAFCLSGGIDSSILAGVAHQKNRDIHAFSVIDKDERYNEETNIQATVKALGCQLHTTHTSTDRFLDRLADLVSYHDAPVSTISYYTHSFLSKAISDAGFKVAVSGTGADELFTGYFDHYSFWLAEMADQSNLPKLLQDWEKGYGRFVRNPLLKDPLYFLDNPSFRDHLYQNTELFSSFLTDAFSEKFVENNYVDSLLRNRMLNELRVEVVPIILAEDDLNSMQCSIENRSPYLDRQLVEFAYSIPTKHLISDGFAKHILRASGRGLIPDMVRLDRRKRGFNAPIDSLLDRSDKNVLERILEPSPIFNIVDREAILKFVKQDLSDNSFSKFMFSFVSSKLFLETVVSWKQSPPQRNGFH